MTSSLFRIPARRTLCVSWIAAVFLMGTSLCYSAYGQQSALPDSPGYMLAASTNLDSAYSSSAPVHAIEPDGQVTAQPYQTADTPGDGNGQQTKRILGIIPNFRSVSVNQHLPPQTIREKFVDATQDSFDYSSVLLPALLAGYSMANDSTPEFHQGAAGYGRYFWHTFVDQTDENYWVEFIVPTIMHEDTRYYTLGHGGKKKRLIYAFKHVIITRNDSGKDVFNSGEVIGAGISSGISTLYYPSRERSFGNVGSQWGLDIGIDAATFAFREFWPDINSHLFHLKDE